MSGQVDGDVIEVPAGIAWVASESLTIRATNEVLVHGWIVAIGDGADIRIEAPKLVLEGGIVTASGEGGSGNARTASEILAADGTVGGNLALLVAELEAVSGSCLATGDGGSGLEIIRPCLPSGQPEVWVRGGAGGDGGHIILQHADFLIHAPTTVYLGNGGDGGQVVVKGNFAGLDIAHGVGGGGGASGTIRVSVQGGEAPLQTAAAYRGVLAASGNGGRGGDSLVNVSAPNGSWQPFCDLAELLGWDPNPATTQFNGAPGADATVDHSGLACTSNAQTGDTGATGTAGPDYSADDWDGSPGGNGGQGGNGGNALDRPTTADARAGPGNAGTNNGGDGGDAWAAGQCGGNAGTGGRGGNGGPGGLKAPWIGGGHNRDGVGGEGGDGGYVGWSGGDGMGQGGQGGDATFGHGGAGGSLTGFGADSGDQGNGGQGGNGCQGGLGGNPHVWGGNAMPGGTAHGFPGPGGHSIFGANGVAGGTWLVNGQAGAPGVNGAWGTSTGGC